MKEWVSIKHLDEAFYQIFNNHKGKKIIVYSAGAALHIVPKFLPEGVKIDYFVDNNYKQWQGQKYAVKSPEELKKEEKGSFLVLIAGQHVLSMIEQLESYGLEEDKDFVNLYGHYEKAFRVAKVDYQAEQMKKFILKIPENSFERDITKKTKIGIVLACTFFSPPMFDIVLFLLLKKRGYDVDLIIDDCYSYENVTMYKGISEEIKEIIVEVVELIKERFDGIIVKYISDYEKAELNEEDLKLVKEATHANAVWQRSRKIDRILAISEEEWYNACYPIYKESLMNIKGFFEENNYDVLNIGKALHGQRYFYPALGERKGIRVSSYDGAGVGSLWTSTGSASHRMDICRVIKENWLSDEEKKKIIAVAQEDFQKRINTTGEERLLGINYQKGKRAKVTENWFDVVIPLNVMWDAAALGRNKLFESESAWLVETVDFILKNTNATILVREHPIISGLGYYNMDCLSMKLKEIFGEEERLYIADIYSKLNTYEYVEHCKLVLPHTTTVGVEAALMGKKVILYAEAYYASLKFVSKGRTKEEYFRYIKEALETKEEFCLTDEAREEAWITYYLGMDYRLKTDFNENDPEWLETSLEEVDKLEEIDDICELIVDGVPICYKNAKNCRR